MSNRSTKQYFYLVFSHGVFLLQIGVHLTICDFLMNLKSKEKIMNENRLNFKKQFMYGAFLKEMLSFTFIAQQSSN